LSNPEDWILHYIKNLSLLF